LRVIHRRAIGGAMKLRGFSACLGLALLLPACRKPAEVTVDSKRPVTMRDEGLKTDAGSDARFQEPGSGPILAGVVPGGWLVQPSSQFRLLNYRFGSGGEVAVGISAGDLPGNVNRWLAQFGRDPLDADAVSALEKIEVMGVSGVWVEAEGDYARLHTDTGSHLVRIPLSALQDRWRDGFLRVHRSYLVALDRVTGLRTVGAATRVCLRGAGQVELPVSRRQVRELKQRLVQGPHPDRR